MASELRLQLGTITLGSADLPPIWTPAGGGAASPLGSTHRGRVLGDHFEVLGSLGGWLLARDGDGPTSALAALAWQQPPVVSPEYREAQRWTDRDRIGLVRPLAEGVEPDHLYWIAFPLGRERHAHRLGEAETLRDARRLFEGLSWLHRSGIAHGAIRFAALLWDDEDVGLLPPTLAVALEGRAAPDPLEAPTPEDDVWNLCALVGLTLGPFRPQGLAVPRAEEILRRLHQSGAMPSQRQIRPLEAGEGSEPEGEFAAGPGDDVRVPAPEPAPDNEPVVDAGVEFTAWHPRDMVPELPAELLVYAHLADEPSEAAQGTPSPRSAMILDAEARLGKLAEKYTPTGETSLVGVPRLSDLTFVPRVAGVRCDPPSAKVRWEPPFRATTFLLTPDPLSRARWAQGRVECYVGLVLVAEVPLRFRVAPSATASASPTVSARPRSLRRIFASYAREDRLVVDQVRRVASLFDSVVHIDTEALRSGGDWRRDLWALIEGAEAMQLFWSPAAAASVSVREEWSHALAVHGPDFIRPVYWEAPLAPVPWNLERLNFAFVSFGERPPEPATSEPASAPAKADAPGERPPGPQGRAVPGNVDPQPSEPFDVAVTPEVSRTVSEGPAVGRVRAARDWAAWTSAASFVLAVVFAAQTFTLRQAETETSPIALPSAAPPPPEPPSATPPPPNPPTAPEADPSGAPNARVWPPMPPTDVPKAGHRKSGGSSMSEFDASLGRIDVADNAPRSPDMPFSERLLTRREVIKALMPLAPALDECRDEWRDAAVVRLRVGWSGRASVVGRSDTPAGRCLANVARGARFGSTGGPMTITVRFRARGVLIDLNRE